MITDDLSDKSVLFFSPKFFTYEVEIKKSLEKLGAKVFWFDDRPSNSFFSKALIRVNRDAIGKRIEAYYTRILEYLKQTGIKFDYVFFLNPEAITEKSLNDFKLAYPDSIFTLYMWDSFENRKRTLQLLPMFDRKYTFDAHDAKKYDLKLQPLFYIDLYKAHAEPQYLYDLLFVGTAHTDRYIYINKLISKFPTDYSKKIYFFLGSKALFWARKLTDRKFRPVKYKETAFKSLTHQENADLIHKSRIILDISHHKQVGLTMRTIESLGAQRKIITTNRDVLNYDFYNENNVLVIDKDNPVIPEKFLKSHFIPSSDNIMAKYSITGWLLEIFTLKYSKLNDNND